MVARRFLQPIILGSGFWLAGIKNVFAQSLLSSPGPVKLSYLNTIFSHIVFDLAIPAFTLAFFVMVTVAGFRFLMSGGDPKAVAGARDTLTYAVAGAVIMILAIIILVFIEQFTKVRITIFNITFPNTL